MKTIDIHLGTPKIGTTSIQYFCTKNFESLQKKGLPYPLIGRTYKESRISKSVFIPTNIEDATLYIIGGILNKPHKLQEILQNFDNCNANSLLLSEEMLFLKTKNNSFHNNPDIWNQLSKYNIIFILYFKRSVEYLCSLWHEAIKNGSKIGLIDYIQLPKYQENIDNLLDLFKTVAKKILLLLCRTFIIIKKIFNS